MPAKSKAQQKAAGAALAAKRGEVKTSTLKGASRQMAASMSERQLKEFAQTKLKGKPDHVAASPSSPKPGSAKEAPVKANLKKTPSKTAPSRAGKR